MTTIVFYPHKFRYRVDVAINNKELKGLSLLELRRTSDELASFWRRPLFFIRHQDDLPLKKGDVCQLSIHIEGETPISGLCKVMGTRDALKLWPVYPNE